LFPISATRFLCVNSFCLFGESLEIQNAVAEIKLRAERRAGEILADMEKNRGAAEAGWKTLFDDQTPFVESSDSVMRRGARPRAPTLGDLGITRFQSHRWQQIAALPETVFEQHIAESRDSGAELTTAALFRCAKQWQRQQMPAAPAPADRWPVNGLNYRLISGDLCEALPKLRPASVDCILTESPPLSQARARHLYETIAREAARLLTPGGSLLLLSQVGDLPEALALFAPHLRYHWTIAYSLPEQQPNRVASRKLANAWLPALWFTNASRSGAGGYEGGWTGDFLSLRVGRLDWSQSEEAIVRLLQPLTGTDGVILDPCAGTGTVGAATLRLHRRFIGIDSDALALAAAAERLAALA